MATLIVHDGPSGQGGRRFPLNDLPAIVGRDPEADIILPSQLVSRRHARILSHKGQLFIEDLGSRNGVFVNDKRIAARTGFTDEDTIRIVEFVLGLEKDVRPELEDRYQKVHEEINVATANLDLYSLQSSQKLKVVLDLSRHLSGALEQEALFAELLKHLLDLFPRADRGVVVLCEKGKFLVQAQRNRNQATGTDFPISRTIVRKALQEGLGILSEDILHDEQFGSSSSLQRLDSRTLLCVPLIGHGGRKLGALQLASTKTEEPFTAEDLHLLSTIGMHVSMVMENLALQQERVQQAQLRKELAMAREIQQSFLPTNFGPLPGGGYELYAVVYPAREVSGDLYDFFSLDDGRLAFFVGDVSGKGMSAALFMVAAHTLTRHLALSSASPSATLRQLNSALGRNNDTGMFVTLVHGMFDPQSGATWLTSGGHPRPLLRRHNGSVAEVSMPTGRLLGAGDGDLELTDTQLTLEPGDTLILYTDGVTEARAQGNGALFGRERFCQIVSSLRPEMTLESWAERIRMAVELYSGSSTIQDDLGLLLLRRV